MKCSEVQKILTEEIHLAESAEVRKHLEVCRECRELQRDLLSLQALSGELKGRTNAPRFFTERVCSRVSGRSRAAYWSLAATAAGLVLITVGVGNFARLSDGDGKAASQTIGGERIQKIDHDGRTVAASRAAQPDVFYLGGEESASQETDRAALGSTRNGLRVVVPKSPKASSSGYVLELPATIEVRQTQADNEFYLENVSH